MERFWTGTITIAQLETVFGDHIHKSLTSLGLRNLELAVISLLLLIQDRGRRWITLQKVPPTRLLLRSRQPRRQQRKRPRVLQLLEESADDPRLLDHRPPHTRTLPLTHTGAHHQSFRP